MANLKKNDDAGRQRRETAIDLAKIEEGVRLILEGIGEDADRPGLQGTPRRVAQMYEEICAGLHVDARRFIHVIPAETHDELVIVKDIPLYGICEHHLLPFSGVAHIAYIPKAGRIVGLSKLARVADMMAKKPQIQERLTTEIADLLYEEIRPTGVMVVIEAEHMCMQMRGIKKPGSKMITSALRGGFLKDPRTRNEAMSLIRDNSR
ncbi:MAG TPA: GTP cyclohydrolase I FolE [Blastocatellia bacterium]|jgi:GTP cyclohydrolase I|nr:GTP cyclohydrolase I FolE [Blastocatellia bacterium]